MTLNQKFAAVFGVVYLLVGVVGFFLTGELDEFAGTEGVNLIIFGINPLHNIVHIGLGVLWLLAATSPAGARGLNMTLGLVLLAVGVAGFFVVDTETNIIALNQPDNFLHIGTAVLALAFGMRKEEAPVVEGG